MTNPTPKVSVLMTVYNMSDYLHESVNSVINQTLSDFEFIIVDDCSTDDSWNILSKYFDEDNRIILIKNSENIGPAQSSNKALKIAKGEYIARLDADDIALPDRLQQQVDYMESNPSVALVSTGVQHIDEAGDNLETYFPPMDSLLLRWKHVYSSPLRHPTVLWRHQLVKSTVNEYDVSYKYALDYDFFVRVSKSLEIRTMPLILVKMRRNPNSISFSKGQLQDGFAAQISSQQFNFYFQDEILSDQEKFALRALLRRYSPMQIQQFYNLEMAEFEKALKNFLRLFKNFCRLHIFDMNVQTVDVLYSQIERTIAQLSQHCLDKGWRQLAANLLLSYLQQYPYRFLPIASSLCSYLMYYNLKKIKLFNQVFAQIRARRSGV